RESYWSNGDPVVAYDFEYAWKKILCPSFLTPLSCIFYPIKNARSVKERRCTIDEVGITAIDGKTLVVDLENPTPYFLKLVATTFYSPINHRIDQLDPNSLLQKGDQFVCNGPFKQKNPTAGCLHELEKDQMYWDHKNTRISKIIFKKSEPNAAVKMFLNNQLDCVGPYMYSVGHLDPSISKKENTRPSHLKVLWHCFNVTHFPFNHLNIRKAFSMAVNRQEHVDSYIGAEFAAYTPIPYQLSQCLDSPFRIQKDETKAKEIFYDALDELEIKIDNFPIIYISTPKFYLQSAKIFKNQWEKVLGVRCEIEVNKSIDFISQLTISNTLGRNL
nr:ABC transporter substrate-binding protein [Simkaniaceae bacterium]